MVVIGLEPGRGAAQPLRPVAGADARGDGELHAAQADDRVGLVRDHAKAGARRELQRERIGLDRHQHPAPHRLSVAVAFELIAIVADQFLQAQAAKIEQRSRAGFSNGLGQARRVSSVG